MKIPVACLLLAVCASQVFAQANPSNKESNSKIIFSEAVKIVGPIGGPNGQNAPLALQVIGGRGGPAGLDENSGSGGGIQLVAGSGGIDASQDAGNGGDITLKAGNGGASSEVGGSGGSITLQPGLAQCGVICGGPGNVILAVPHEGSVGVGTNTPNNTLEVVVGGTTLADAWTTRSSRRFKVNIQPLLGALERVEQLQAVEYQRKSDGRREMGLIAEDVDRVVPEVVSRDPKTDEVQGVDYARLTSLLIEAVKTQQAEILALRQEVRELRADRR